MLLLNFIIITFSNILYAVEYYYSTTVVNDYIIDCIIKLQFYNSLHYKT